MKAKDKIVGRLIVFVVMISSVVFPCSVYSGAPDMKTAETLYKNGEFREAAEAYLSVAKMDGVSSGLYYDIANSYAQCGDYGNAVLYYSRAQRLDPSNKDIENNLNYFLSKVEDSNRAELRGKKVNVAPDAETFFQSAHRMIAADVKSDFWAVLAVICFILCLVGVVVYLFCSNVLLRKAGFFGGIAVFFLCIFFVVFAFMSAGYHDSHDTAVLMAYKTELLLEPSSDSKPATNQLCQGTRFDIIAEEADIQGVPTWYKVRLNSDIEGWIKASDVAII